MSSTLHAAPPERLTLPSRALARQPVRYALIGLAALLVALLPPLISAGVIAGVAVLFVLLTRPFAALCTLAFAVPFESVRNIHAGGVNVTITNFIVFCVALAWITRGVSSGSMQVGPTPWRPALLIYGAVLVLSVTQATDYVLSVKELLKWGQLLFVYLAGVTLVRTRRELRTLLIVLFVAVIAESLVGVGQVVLHSGPSSFARGAVLRGAGTFEQPNPFAGYLNMTLPLAVACLIFHVFPRKRMWLVAIVTAGGVLASLSRGGELGTVTALIAMGAALSARVRGLLLVGLVSLVGLIALAAVGVVPSSVTEPLAQGFGVANVDVINPTPLTWSVAERLAHMEAGLAMWGDHLALGAGIGNYPAQYVHYRVAPVWGPSLGHAHNYYINIGAEAGIVGLAAFLILLGSAYFICIRAYRRAPDPLGRAIALGALGVMVGFSFHMLFDDLFVHGMEVQIALVMTLATRAGYGLEAEEGVPASGSAERAAA